MQGKIILVVLGLTFWITSGNALTCYSCKDSNNGTCFYPSRNQTASCTTHSRSLDTDLRSIYGEGYLEDIGRTFNEVKCVHYEKKFNAENRTEVFRGCLDSTYADEFCKNHNANQQYFDYKLTKCNICNDDFCNSSYRISASVFNSVFFCAIAFVISKVCH